MKALVSFPDSKNLDKSMLSDPYNMSVSELIENASRGIVSAMLDSLQELQNKAVPILFLVGNGNNGMDALTVARYLLFAGFTNLSIVLHEKKSEQTASKFRQIHELCKQIYTFEKSNPAELKEFSVIIDGILGIGADRPIENFGYIAALIENNPRSRVISVDIPSGIFEANATNIAGDTLENIVSATHTYSILPLKYACFFPGFRKYCGIIHEIPLVFPLREVSSMIAEKKCVQLLEQEDLQSLVPSVHVTAHKYERGSLLIFSGSIGSTGAPLLAAKAAISSGAGLVTLRVPEPVYKLMAGTLTGIVIEPDTSADKRKYHAVLCGPGWEMHDQNKNILQKLWTGELPLVVDGSALHLITTDFLEGTEGRQTQIICTPHLGEMSKMLVNLGMARSYEEAFNMTSYDTRNTSARLASQLGAVILLKSASTWVTSPTGNLYVYDGYEPGLAVGGSGDVLAGIVAALLSRGASAEHAACAAVLAHGISGRKAASESGFFDAPELITRLSALMYGVSV